MAIAGATEEVEVWDEETYQAATLIKRFWCLRFPSLAKCRESFEVALKQAFPWGESAPGGEEEHDAS
jgi:hypothetical protein